MTYIIAEMACSHEGDINKAKTIIDAAGASKADAIQFQVWKAHNIMSPKHKDFELLKRIELTYEAWEGLFLYVKEKFPSMEVIACVYDLESINFCEKLGVDAYKIHCADMANPLIIRAVASTNKRIDLSVGGSTEIEIKHAIQWIKSQSSAPIWMMYGLQNFPTPTSDINFDFMDQLSKAFDLPLGYQDHSDPETNAGFWMPAAAVTKGVTIIEKHITHDRSFKGVDHQAALNPDEFKEFCDMIRSLDLSSKKSAYPKVLTDAEAQYRDYSRKSIVLAQSKQASDVIDANDLLFLRTDTMGMSPENVNTIIGKKLNKSKDAYVVILEEDCI